MDINPDQMRSPAEAREAVAKAIKTPNCPFCGADQWMPAANDRVLILQEAPLTAWGNPSEDSDDWIATGAVGFICEECGFLRVHAPTGP